jgi:hypothetical protein
MEISIFIIITILVLYLLYKPQVHDYFTTIRVKSDSDFNEYPVVSLYNDTQKAANIMGDVNLFTVDLIKKMQAKYLNKETGVADTVEYVKGREITITLINRFASNSLKENEPVSSDATSYTINKGDVIGICLREKQSGKNNFHDIDDIKFVLLHELAHIVTPEYSHTPLFWTNFRFLLEFCKSNGLYHTPDYASRNVNYCGTTITYNPMDDNKLKSYFR